MPTQGDPVRGGLPVEPEPNPGEHDNQSTGQIDLDNEQSLSSPLQQFLRKVLMNSPELENIPCVAVTEKLLAELTMIQLVKEKL